MGVCRTDGSIEARAIIVTCAILFHTLGEQVDPLHLYMAAFSAMIVAGLGWGLWGHHRPGRRRPQPVPRCASVVERRFFACRLGIALGTSVARSIDATALEKSVHRLRGHLRTNGCYPLPTVRIYDDTALPPRRVVVLGLGQVVASWDAQPGMMLAWPKERTGEDPVGTEFGPVTHPVLGIPAAWVPRNMSAETNSEYETASLEWLIAWALQAAVLTKPEMFYGLEEAGIIFATLQVEYPNLYRALVDSGIGLLEFHFITEAVVATGRSLRCLPLALETIALSQEPMTPHAVQRALLEQDMLLTNHG